MAFSFNGTAIKNSVVTTESSTFLKDIALLIILAEAVLNLCVLFNADGANAEPSVPV